MAEYRNITVLPLINTVASARCQEGRWNGKLFQQFLTGCGKPLKRLTGCGSPVHRAEATVLMRNSLSGCERFWVSPRKRFQLSSFASWFWFFGIYWVAAELLLAAAPPGGPEDIPPLRPPQGELGPTFWEQNGLWVVLAGLLLLGIIGVIIWRLTRPKPPIPVPPATQARQALAPLSQQPEDGALLSRVSQILRHYMTAAFGLPPGELTTTEFCRALTGQESVGPELANTISDFLHQCDQRKFAPAVPASPLGAVGQATQLIDLAEARRAALAAPTTQTAASASVGVAKPGGAQ